MREALRIKLKAGSTVLQLARENGVGKRRMQKVLAELCLTSTGTDYDPAPVGSPAHHDVAKHMAHRRFVQAQMRARGML